MKKILFFFIAMSTFSSTSFAEVFYGISNQTPVSSMIQFSIPYSMGVHEGYAKAVKGNVVTDEDDNVISAQFQVPVLSLRTGNSTRDCHMFEALGINYDQSRFPEEHVCDSNDELPSSGPDSIQYPEITIGFEGMSLPSEPFTIGVPQFTNVKVKNQIHGVEKIQTLPVMITKTVNSAGAQGFQLSSQFVLSLKDFDVQVRPVKIFGMKIGVKDQVKIQVALNLVKR